MKEQRERGEILNRRGEWGLNLPPMLVTDDQRQNLPPKQAFPPLKNSKTSKSTNFSYPQVNAAGLETNLGAGGREGLLGEGGPAGAIEGGGTAKPCAPAPP